MCVCVRVSAVCAHACCSYALCTPRPRRRYGGLRGWGAYINSCALNVGGGGQVVDTAVGVSWRCQQGWNVPASVRTCECACGCRVSCVHGDQAPRMARGALGLGFHTCIAKLTMLTQNVFACGSFASPVAHARFGYSNNDFPSLGYGFGCYGRPGDWWVRPAAPNRCVAYPHSPMLTGWPWRVLCICLCVNAHRGQFAVTSDAPLPWDIAHTERAIVALISLRCFAVQLG